MRLLAVQVADRSRLVSVGVNTDATRSVPNSPRTAVHLRQTPGRCTTLCGMPSQSRHLPAMRTMSSLDECRDDRPDHRVTPPLLNIDRPSEWRVGVDSFTASTSTAAAAVTSFPQRLPSWRRRIMQMSHSFSGKLPEHTSLDNEHSEEEAEQCEK